MPYYWSHRLPNQFTSRANLLKRDLSPFLRLFCIMQKGVLWEWRFSMWIEKSVHVNPKGNFTLRRGRLTRHSREIFTLQHFRFVQTKQRVTTLRPSWEGNYVLLSIFLGSFCGVSDKHFKNSVVLHLTWSRGILPRKRRPYSLASLSAPPDENKLEHSWTRINEHTINSSSDKNNYNVLTPVQRPESCSMEILWLRLRLRGISK